MTSLKKASHSNPTIQIRVAPHLELLEERVVLSTYRSFDGTGNNTDNPTWGATDTQLQRLTTVEYGDSISTPAGAGRPNARDLSNQVAAQSGDIFNDRFLTSFVFQWGQFLDHDLDLSENAIPVENFSVTVPNNDPVLNPNVPIPLLRSIFDPATGTDASNPRQQINEITSYIDASNVYGSDAERAEALRTHTGGLLKTSSGDFLPYNFINPNTGTFYHNAAPPPLGPTDYFLAGDIRANEQPGLTSMHTLFLREHNRLAGEIAAAEYSGMDLSDPTIDEEIYQKAREIVGAYMQVITYYEFLPALMGPNNLDSYSGYKVDVNAAVANIFSGAMYRIGHTMLPNELLRLDNNGNPVLAPIGLGDAFFDPTLVTSIDIDPFLKGLSANPIQEIDNKIVDGVRNMLFDPPAQFDLAAINIQRGRDHGLPDLNQVREDFGLKRYRSFREINPDFDVWLKLYRAYGGDINNIDPWLGGISEKHITGGSIGETMQAVLVDQFTRSRDGDRFYFEHNFSGQQLTDILNTRLSDIILRNTNLTNIQAEVFRSETVFTFRADAGSGSVDITLRLGAGQTLEVVDNTTGTVLSSQTLSDTDSVVLYGTNADDRIVVDKGQRWNIPVEVHGLAGEDTLEVLGSNRRDMVSVHPNEVRIMNSPIYFGTTETVVVKTLGHSDMARVHGNVTFHVVLDGGSGNDMLMGGSGNDIILGQDGNDVLVGKGGHDLLIGGTGRDILLGSTGNDILFGNSTTFDNDLTSLLAILDTWTDEATDTGDKITFLENTYFTPANVINDAQRDYLFDGLGDNWFPSPFARDRILPRIR